MKPGSFDPKALPGFSLVLHEAAENDSTESLLTKVLGGLRPRTPAAGAAL